MFFFFLLLTPSVTPACVLWMDHPPIVNDYRPPTCALDLMLSWDWYDLRLISGDGRVLCEWPAAGDGLITIPCVPNPWNLYHIEVWLNTNSWACDIKSPELTSESVALQCPEWLDAYQAGTLEIRGPFEIWTPPAEAAACTLPQVDNSAPLDTSNDYQFLAGRLSWWGIDISALDWQNRFDDQIRAASDAAGIPAPLLKGMLANESQFWPLWTGDSGEVGWLQLTWAGADTALRHDPELYDRYCNGAVWAGCNGGYDLLNSSQQNAIRSSMMADLTVTGTPVDAAAQAAEDLWIYAHVLRAYACQAEDLYPEMELWWSAAVLYNAGSSCIRGGIICTRGRDYLDHVLK